MDRDILCRATDVETVMEENRVAALDGILDEFVLVWLVGWIPIVFHTWSLHHSTRMMSGITSDQNQVHA